MNALRHSVAAPKGMPHERRPPEGYVLCEYIEAQSSSIGTWWKTPVELHMIFDEQTAVDAIWSMGNSSYIGSDCHFGGDHVFSICVGIYQHKTRIRFDFEDSLYSKWTDPRIETGDVCRVLVDGLAWSLYVNGVQAWAYYHEQGYASDPRWTNSEFATFRDPGYAQDVMIFGGEQYSVSPGTKYSAVRSHNFRPGSRLHRFMVWNGTYGDGFCAVPVKNLATGLGELYDAFSGQLCVKVGSGTYLAGPELT